MSDGYSLCKPSSGIDAQSGCYSRRKPEQIRYSKAEQVVVPYHGCHGQLRTMLDEQGLSQIEVKYLWEMVAESLVVD